MDGFTGCKTAAADEVPLSRVRRGVRAVESVLKERLNHGNATLDSC
jgi:hypothetical protein